MDKMRGVSQLAQQLEKEAPDSVLALERRAREDQETAIRLLQSQCYYDGEASFSMDDKVKKPVLVTLKLVAGPRYKGRPCARALCAQTRHSGGLSQPFSRNRLLGTAKEAPAAPSFPETVPGVEAGKPIVADDMLAAVSAIPDNLRKTGYPLAKVEKTVYTLDKPGSSAQCGRYNKPGAGRGHGRYRDIRGQDREPGIPAASRALETGQGNPGTTICLRIMPMICALWASSTAWRQKPMQAI